MKNDFINKMGEYWSQLSFDKLGDILTYHHNAPILFSSGLFFFLFIGFLSIYMSPRKHLRIVFLSPAVCRNIRFLHCAVYD